MRVIAGEFRSRKLVAPPGEATRPTPDRLRESLFSILQLKIEGAVFYDLYAGSGAVGIEALSRGAARAVFVESSREALAALHENLKSLQVGGRAQVVNKRVHQFLASGVRGIVFADPPYTLPKEYEKFFGALSGHTENIEELLVQHGRRLAVPTRIGNLERHRELKQGDNVVSFYGLPEVAGNEP
jgi:16S rRNA (guanine(966)-N(2))-methyltransferase RsmD